MTTVTYEELWWVSFSSPRAPSPLPQTRAQRPGLSLTLSGVRDSPSRWFHLSFTCCSGRLSPVGKRRGGVFLKTGVVVKKQKQDTEATPGKSDAWSKYMAEVKKYKAHQCSDDDKTRPLVK
ncbi:telomerase RNA component interacting RNase isoform X3 [Cynoglossus semilaevis]|uniref:telomerase RNA component interacting RNase isoform X3 n=1 Tax=Cynoglossus semilaevis TaxID=244447 RepID=UPI000D6274FC|nr:telomerase RNA component interacting RNase isoform X3 [Cynoglossus semilaevis]